MDETTVTRPDTAPPANIRIDADLRSGGQRYEILDTLGRGGMGEVTLCRDKHIGREVAVKRELDARTNDPRFLREALVQGQLEHPAVVPVYDIAVGPDGAAFFVMKRVRGASLRAILDDLARGEGTATYTRHKLLAAMSRICLAVDFAHSRGVVHRDLKPANLMLGVWGEVYVLDWGIAKVVGAPDPDVPAPAADQRISGSGQHTAQGMMLGTPGYIAPEQIDGHASVATDIYALGVILFEILALERLHPGRSVYERVSSTALGETRLRERLAARGAAPELIAICERATSLAPAERFGSARDLHDALERFLEGDRDLELRRTLSSQHTARASELAATKRSEALRELGRALALAPDNRSAHALLRTLLTSMPDELPAVARTELAQLEADTQLSQGRNGQRAMIVLFVILVLLCSMGVRDWRILATYAALFVVTLVHGVMFRRLASLAWHRRIALVLLLLGIPLLGRTFGPLVFVPSLLTAFGGPIMMHTPRRERFAFALPMCAAVFIGPIVLEALGVLEPSYVLRDGGILIMPHMVWFTGLAVPTLTFMSFATVILPLMMIGFTADNLRDARRRMAFQTWQLRQLGPEEEPTK